jgi:hypothetical protein
MGMGCLDVKMVFTGLSLSRIKANERRHFRFKMTTKVGGQRYNRLRVGCYLNDHRVGGAVNVTACDHTRFTFGHLVPNFKDVCSTL